MQSTSMGTVKPNVWIIKMKVLCSECSLEWVLYSPRSCHLHMSCRAYGVLDQCVACVYTMCEVSGSPWHGSCIVHVCIPCAHDLTFCYAQSHCDDSHVMRERCDVVAVALCTPSGLPLLVTLNPLKCLRPGFIIHCVGLVNLLIHGEWIPHIHTFWSTQHPPPQTQCTAMFLEWSLDQ